MVVLFATGETPAKSETAASFPVNGMFIITYLKGFTKQTWLQRQVLQEFCYCLKDTTSFYQPQSSGHSVNIFQQAVNSDQNTPKPNI